ncbi:MAG: double-strand break repair protein AddB [Kordiimonas sp.]|nr:double-strand break repair protein AddB [Kordiimonas sp.]
MTRRKYTETSVYTIRSGVSFVDALAQGVQDRYGGDPLMFSRVTILLPNRRAARSLRDSFLRLSGGKAQMLPRMQPIGDVDEDEVLLSGAILPQGSDDLTLAPAIPPLQRQMLLMNIIRRWYKAQGENIPNGAQAAILARALGQLLDQVQTHRLSFAQLETLVPDDYAAHWQQTLDFLQILIESWPDVLIATGYMDAVARRDHLMSLFAEGWRQRPPETPVIAAGSTGSIPATRDLLKVVAGLPMGHVVLPGLACDMDSQSWDQLDPTHPQYTMKQLLSHMDVEREDVTPWLAEDRVGAAGCASAPVQRDRFFQYAFRPAATCQDWVDLTDSEEGKKLVKEAAVGVTRLDVPGLREEAGIIALMMREVLETPGKTAALVTPDRNLARRVGMELQRWDIQVDDSAGTPLLNTAVGRFLRLTAEMINEDLAPVALLAALKHPLCAGGEELGLFRKNVRRLERLVLRGPRPAPGVRGITATLKAMVSPAAEDEAENIKERDKKQRAAAVACGAWWQGIAAHIAPFAAIMPAEEASFAELLQTHLMMVEALAATSTQTGAERLWRGEDGIEAARLMEELQLAAEHMGPLPPSEYAALLDVFMGGLVVRPAYGGHARLHIWGPLEARLQHTDLMILGGLNEGIWPPETSPDPWMSRPMREKFGLPPLEEKIGLSAHDFLQAAGAKDVVMIRSEKVDGAPTVRSRWLARLEALWQGDNLSAGQNWQDWYMALDRLIPAGVPGESIVGPAGPYAPPAPCPPVAARPRELSVTQVQTWMQDPYALYVQKILKLSVLDPLDADPGALEKGNFIHAALEKFLKTYPGALPPNSVQQLLSMGRDAFGEALARPTVWAFWWPRYCQIAAWFIEKEQERRAAGCQTIGAEVWARQRFPGPAGDFILKAKADRIDRLQDGSLSIIDYKTGKEPSARQLHAGYAPQLPLEAVMAHDGSFDDIPAGSVSELAYWRLHGGDPAGEIKTPEKDSVDELRRKAADGLRDLIAAFDRQETPYLSKPRPGVLGYGDYDHLARVKEWIGSIEAGDHQ